jgi:hypothetical protein
MASNADASESTEPLSIGSGPLDLEQAIDTRTAGRILGLDEITLQQHRMHGKGARWFRIGRSVRYRLGDVLAFRDARMVGKAP